MEIKVNRIIGLEVANSSIKAVFGQKDDEEFTYRNTVEEIEYNKINDELRINFDNILTYKNKNYKVGLVSALGSGGVTDLRYESEQFKMECLFAIARIVKMPNEQIYLATGVPAAEYENNIIIEKIKKNLMGDHVVYYQDIRRTFSIVEIAVYPQPIGTFIDYLFTKDLKERVKETEMYEDIMISDLGWGSADFCVVNLEKGVSKVKSIYEGMLKVNSDIMEEINRRYPELNIYRHINSPHQLDQMLQKTTKIKIGNKQQDVSEIVELVHNKYVKGLYEKLLNMGYILGNYYKIIFTGGASIMLEKAIRKQFKECNIEFIKEPVKANARGFYILGKQNFRMC